MLLVKEIGLELYALVLMENMTIIHPHIVKLVHINVIPAILIQQIVLNAKEIELISHLVYAQQDLMKIKSRQCVRLATFNA